MSMAKTPGVPFKLHQGQHLSVTTESEPIRHQPAVKLMVAGVVIGSHNAPRGHG